MLFSFASVFLFLVVGFVFLAFTLLLSRLIQAKGKPGIDKYIPYECGEVPQGSAWIRFNIRFYVFALIFIILLQRGKGGGLSAALGGGMASGLLGSKTGDVLTWVTIVLVGVFLVLGIVMAKYYKPTTGEYGTPSGPVTSTSQSAPAVPTDQNAAQATSTPATVPGPNAPIQ